MITSFYHSYMYMNMIYIYIYSELINRTGLLRVNESYGGTQVVMIIISIILIKRSTFI